MLMRGIAEMRKDVSTVMSDFLELTIYIVPLLCEVVQSKQCVSSGHPP